MPTWEIVTFGNGELLAMLFNGIVAVMGDDNFNTLIRLAGVVGLLWVIFKAALFQARQADWGWFLIYILVYGALFVPKASVTIVDRLDPGATRTIANVPVGLAAFAGTMSLVGDWMTRSSEAVFTLPDDLRYARSGAVFGAHLMQSAREFRITDPDFEAAMAEFMRQCVFYDLLLRHYTWRDLLEAPNAWQFIRDNTSRYRRFTFTCYTPRSGTVLPGCSEDGEQIFPVCRDGANGVLNGAWDAELVSAARIYGRKIFSGEIDEALATSRLIGTLPVSYDYLARITASGQEIMRANMLANLWEQALGSASASADASAATESLALSQAEARQRTTYAVLGQLMSKWLPLMRNLYEAILYGVFPFVFLLFLMPWGMKVAGGYLKNILWLQLWPPIFAILNLAMTLYQRHTSQALVGDAQAGLPVSLQAGLGEIASDTAILAGYMAMSIPLIAYGLITGGQMALSQLASQIGAVAQSAAARSADVAATGNVSMGNLSMSNTGMFRNSSSPTADYGLYTQTDPASAARIHGGTDAVSVQAATSSLPFSAAIERQVLTATQNQYSEARQAAERESSEYARQSAAALNAAFQYAQSTSFGRNYQDLWRGEEGANARHAYEQMRSAARELSEKAGYSQVEAESIVATLSAGIQAGLGFEALQGQLGGWLRREDKATDEIRSTYEQLARSLDQERIAAVTEHLSQHARTSQASDLYGTDRSLADQLVSSHARLEQERTQHQASLEELRRAEQAYQTAQRYAESTSLDLASMLVQVARRAGIDPSFLGDVSRAEESAAVAREWLALRPHYAGRSDGDEAALRKAYDWVMHGAGDKAPNDARWLDSIRDRAAPGAGAWEVDRFYEASREGMSGHGGVDGVRHRHDAAVEREGARSGLFREEVDLGRMAHGTDRRYEEAKRGADLGIVQAGTRTRAQGERIDEQHGGREERVREKIEEGKKEM